MSENYGNHHCCYCNQYRATKEKIDEHQLTCEKKAAWMKREDEFKNEAKQWRESNLKEILKRKKVEDELKLAMLKMKEKSDHEGSSSSNISTEQDYDWEAVLKKKYKLS